jgi:hypothetical protein
MRKMPEVHDYRSPMGGVYWHEKWLVVHAISDMLAAKQDIRAHNQESGQIHHIDTKWRRRWKWRQELPLILSMAGFTS